MSSDGRLHHLNRSEVIGIAFDAVGHGLADSYFGRKPWVSDHFLESSITCKTANDVVVGSERHRRIHHESNPIAQHLH